MAFADKTRGRERVGWGCGSGIVGIGEEGGKLYVITFISRIQNGFGSLSTLECTRKRVAVTKIAFLVLGSLGVHIGLLSLIKAVKRSGWVEASALDLPIFLAEDMHRRRQHMSSSYSRADTIPAEALRRQRGKQKLLDSLDVILSPPFAPSFLPFPADLSWGSKSDNHLEAGVREWRGESEGVGEGKRHGILLQI